MLLHKSNVYEMPIGISVNDVNTRISCCVGIIYQGMIHEFHVSNNVWTRVATVSSYYKESNTEKLNVSRCLGSMMKHEARVFDMASQTILRSTDK